MVGIASVQEKEELKTLWQICFHEEQRFLDWFFDERFLPAYCVRKIVDGRIVCAMHGLPLHARFRNQILPVVLVSGVSTLPEFRGRGYMRQVFTCFLNTMHSYGTAAVLYHPVDASIYSGFMHYSCADAAFVTPEPLPLDLDMPRNAHLLDLTRNTDALYQCYQSFSQQYSASISRSYADFILKMQDYHAGSGKCIAVFGEQSVDGYCVYFDEGDTLYGDECVAHDNAAYKTLLTAFRAVSGKNSVKLRLPPDALVQESAIRRAVMPHSLIGAVSVPCLLAATGLSAHIPFAVTDPIIPGNNATFLPDGSMTDATPHLCINAGRLAQWAIGYRTMRDIVDAGEATLLCEDSLPVIDSIGTRKCYLVDEY